MMHLLRERNRYEYNYIVAEKWLRTKMKLIYLFSAFGFSKKRSEKYKLRTTC
ncbi:MAG: hypothetical protein ACXWQO_04650 [Bdellovibrionota bacterium]